MIKIKGSTEAHGSSSTVPLPMRLNWVCFDVRPSVILYATSKLKYLQEEQERVSEAGAWEMLIWIELISYPPQGTELLIVSISNDLIGKPCASQKPPPQLHWFREKLGSESRWSLGNLPCLLSEWFWKQMGEELGRRLFSNCLCLLETEHLISQPLSI